MSTPIFDRECHGTPGSITLRAVAKKRVRRPLYKPFGAKLKEWRGERDIEEVVRKIVGLGVNFSGPTLRMWEYGWIGRPDPLRLLALAQVYKRSLADVMQALAIAREIEAAIGRDLPRHDDHLQLSGQTDDDLSDGESQTITPASPQLIDHEGHPVSETRLRGISETLENAAHYLAGLRIGTPVKQSRRALSGPRPPKSKHREKGA